MAPLQTIGGALVVPVKAAEPTYQDPSSQVVLEHLRRIEVVAVVPLHEVALVHLHRLQDGLGECNIACLAKVVPLVVCARETLWRKRNIVAFFHLHDVGTLPHISKGILRINGLS